MNGIAIKIGCSFESANLGTLEIPSTEDIPVSRITVGGFYSFDSVDYLIGSAQLSAEVFPANATNQSVSWISSNESIALVSMDGVVTVLDNGRIRISAISSSSPGVIGYIDVECLTGAEEEVTLLSPAAIVASGALGKTGGASQLYVYDTLENRVSVNAATGEVAVSEDTADANSCDVTYMLYRVTSTIGDRVAVGMATVPTIKQSYLVDLTGRIGYMPYTSNKVVNAKSPITLYAEFVLERGTDGACLFSDRISGKNHCMTISRFGSRTVTADGLGGALVCRAHKRDDTYSTATNDDVGSLIEHTLFTCSDNTEDGTTLFDGIAGANVSYQLYNNETSNVIGFNYEYPQGYANDSLPDITGMTAVELSAAVTANSALVKSGTKSVKLKRLIIHDTFYQTIEELMANLDTASVNLVGANDGRLLQLGTTGGNAVLSLSENAEA